MGKLFASSALLVLLLVPAVSHAWMLTTRVNTASGQLQVNAYPVQTGGVVIQSIPAGTEVNIVITPASGYVISRVQQGATYLSVTPAGQTVTIPATNTASQAINAWFSPALVSVIGAAGPGGTVSPVGSQNLQQGSVATYVFTPAAGNNVASISGLPVGATVSPSLPAPPNTPVTVSFVVPSTAVTMNGVFTGVIASAGAPQTAFVGNTVTLDGSGSIGATSYAWSQTMGPVTVTLSDPTAARPTFQATVGGGYQFKLVINGTTTAYTSVFVSDTPINAAQTQCQNCHQPLGIGSADNVFGKWSASPHPNASPAVMCYSCHVGANTGGHPGPPLTSLANVCANCHTDASGSVPNHPLPIGTITCTTCHDPHATTATSGNFSQGPPHYNNITSGMYPASFVTSKATCTDCHTNTPNNSTIRQQWYTSAHAKINDLPWRSYDFKTKSGCVQCHTATGFIAYSSGRMTNAWGTASDKTKEVLRCTGCHSDISAGVVRTVTPVRPFADDAYTNRNVGESNICMDCHSGTNNGQSISTKAGTADFTALPFIPPHFLSAGGTLHGKSGYNFPGQTYAFYSSNTHRSIGMGNYNNTGTAGPCIACHKNDVNGHTFDAAITPYCTTCHGSSFSATQLAGYQSDFANGLAVLKATLALRGFVYSQYAPFFTNTNWGTGQEGANVMGAAFNYVLLVREPGAFAHNGDYAKKLIFDSIDAVYNNGTITGSIDSALSDLVNSSLITQDVATSVTAYKAKTTCTTCHGGPAASTTPMATNAHPTHLTSAYGPGQYLGTGVGACQKCHPYPNQHANGVVDLVGGSCSGCHPGTVPTWTSPTRLDCTTCHAATPSVLPNGVAAPYKPNFATTGHGQFPESSLCTNCHDPNSTHITGSLGSTSRLLIPTAGNALCSSCHDDNVAPLMVTHFTTLGGTPDMLCTQCHDTHGTGNLYMIRATVNNQPITVTNVTTGLIDTTTNQGFCQVCHTQTAHYRAGVPETQHYTSNCLSCHIHNATAGAFMPAFGSCNSCHGYPPAPAGFVGTQGNWSSARAENYQGGGGAHTLANHVNPKANPSDGFTNCVKCHNPNDHQINPVVFLPSQNIKVSVNQTYRYVASMQARYTSNRLDGTSHQTGSCSNISCHFGATPKWDPNH